MKRSAFFGFSAGGVSIIAAIYLFLTNSDNFSFLFDFIVLATVLFLVPLGLDDLFRQRRIREIEDRIPDFLMDVAEASKFGTNLADSIVNASNGQYGALSAEIRKVAAQIRWGVSVDESLNGLIERYPTPFIAKVLTTMIEANRSGGNVSEVLSMIAANSRETQILTREKYSQVASYVIIIVIAYAVFLLTVLILNVQFFPAMSREGAAAITSASLINASTIPEVKVIFTGVVIIQGIGGGMMTGVLRDGRYQSGFLYAAALSAAGYVTLLLFGGV
jgi:flagellar protein FlaJ